MRHKGQLSSELILLRHSPSHHRATQPDTRCFHLILSSKLRLCTCASRHQFWVLPFLNKALNKQSNLAEILIQGIVASRRPWRRSVLIDVFSWFVAVLTGRGMWTSCVREAAIVRERKRHIVRELPRVTLHSNRKGAACAWWPPARLMDNLDSNRSQLNSRVVKQGQKRVCCRSLMNPHWVVWEWCKKKKSEYKKSTHLYSQQE